MSVIDYGSVCSGIEAATVAVHPLGWKAAWFAEIEAFPSAVLAHHYPDVENLGDMTKIARAVLNGRVHAPSLLVGGTPCQAFSVAGMRAGLDDARGQLTIKFVELADAIDHVRIAAGRPESVVWWENVPGVLSDKANAFGCFLAALVGESDALKPSGGKWTNAGCVYGPTRAAAWRVLDAQYFGLAQRRRRVFVVASARAGFDPAEVLFEREGVRRDHPPSRKPTQNVAATIAGGSRERGGYSTDDIPLTAGTITSNAFSGGMGGRPEGAAAGHFLPVTAQTLMVCTPKSDRGDDANLIVGPVSLAYGGGNTSGPIDPAACLTAKGMRIDFEVETFVVQGTQDPSVNDDMAHTLGRNSGQENAVFSVALRGRDGGATAEIGDDLSGTLRASSGGGDKAHALVGAAVRRLTPLECERLQGFPDGYTRIPMRLHKVRTVTDSRPADMWEKVDGGWMLMSADGPRYKAIGNSKATSVVRWIARRIEAQVNRLQHANDNNPATTDQLVG